MYGGESMISVGFQPYVVYIHVINLSEPIDICIHTCLS